ncbi:MAG TPA: tetratricopeptide repeat protein, partial [Candidatus Aquilonibacter sp.]|nr:tetratricopeptide repeat protein [Candidatus Aquilonibacter sp.]
MTSDQAWEDRVARLWESIDAHTDEQFVAEMERLAAELPQDDPRALFERACAKDSTGHSDGAVPLYDRALKAGLEGIRRRRAVIQMASSLRNLGNS